MRLGGYVRERTAPASQSLRQKAYILLAIILGHVGLVQLFVVLTTAQPPEMIEHVDYFDITTFDEEGNPMLVEDGEESPAVAPTTLGLTSDGSVPSESVVP